MGAEQGIVTAEDGQQLNKVEALKRVKDGLDVWDDIFRYAKEGWSAITDEDFVRMRWFGVYQQLPNNGHFMLRVRIPNGFLRPAQLRAIGQIAEEHGRGFGDITTRQNIQLHWLTIEAIADALPRLAQVGLVTRFACGDTPRNVVGCPMAGYLPNEIIDAGPATHDVNAALLAAGKELSNLPRKFKTAIGGCRLHCHQPQINDIGLFGVQRQHPATGAAEVGYGLVVGGGLSTTPHVAQGLRVFVKSDQVKDVCLAIARIFRDSGYRAKRTRARLKFLVADWGWEKFRAALERELGYALEHDASIVAPDGATHTDHMGSGPQKQAGLSYIGVPIERGRLTARQMLDAAHVAERFGGAGKALIGLSNKQNLLFINVPTEHVPMMSTELEAHDLRPHAPLWRHNLITCTGSQFCNLAIVETKDRAAKILKFLEEEVEIDAPILVSVTGCPNACGQYQIADIGLMGVVCNYQGVRGTEAYNVLLGGALGKDAGFAKLMLKKVPADLVHHVIRNIVEAYQANRADEQETFREFVQRHTPEQLHDWLQIPEMAAVK